MAHPDLHALGIITACTSGEELAGLRTLGMMKNDDDADDRTPRLINNSSFFFLVNLFNNSS